MIAISDLHKSFDHVRILDGVNLSIARGEVVVIIGPSGSGKSTLLRCINGLENFQEGQIKVAEVTLTPEMFRRPEFGAVIRSVRRKVGMVFQSFNLFPHLTALENVTLAPVKVLGQERQEAAGKAKELLERVNLQGKEHQYPRSLSGGEQQRVAIARALAMNPEAILFDEPTSSLDPELVGEVLSVISDLASQGYTMLIVTHQMHFARQSANRIVFLDKGEIIEEGSPAEIFENPKSERARNFLKNFQG